VNEVTECGHDVLLDRLNPAELLPLASEIVAAHVSNNKITVTDLPQLIREVYQAFAHTSTGETGQTPRGEPAVPSRGQWHPTTLCASKMAKR
jgi:predicted transcriptional regulator